MSASDAVILLVADGLVAVGRVLGRFRRPCVAEKRAQAVDALNALEDSQDGLEPGDLSAFGLQWPTKADKDRAFGELKTSLDRIVAAERGEPSPQRSAAVSRPAADNTRCAAAASIAGDPFLCCLDTGHAGPHHNPHQTVSWIDAGADEGTAAGLFAIGPADGTDQTAHLEAAYNYHRPQANYNGTLVWGCEGCNWAGSTIQAHARHRFQVLADMSAATGRVNEQLDGAS